MRTAKLIKMMVKLPIIRTFVQLDIVFQKMKNYSDESYNEIVSSLFRRHPSFGAVGNAAYSPGLECITQLCRSFGDPQNRFPSIHVAGTNGKGSCANMLAAHFAASGLKVGLYTSPHIIDFRERVRVIENASPRLISRLQVWDFLQRFGENDEASLFETTTLMAFDFFAREKVDLAIIETGLGGRLDATNVIVPKLSLITNIGYDHMNLLGGTLPEIAQQKAGIIKPGVPVVVGEYDPLTAPVFRRVAGASNSPLYFADNGDAPLEGADSKGCAWDGESFDLKGIYQRRNVVTVLKALQVLGQEPDIQALRCASKICGFHGRWEKVCDNPMTICDIGHNEHGLKYNFAQLESYLERGLYSDIVIVYGSVADKDIDAVLRIIPASAHLFLTAAATPRAMSPVELLSRCGRPDAVLAGSVAESVTAARKLCATMEKPLLYIGGSTYIVSEALPCFE